MKKIIKYFVIIFTAIFLLMLILPFAFKGKIEKIIQQKVNENIQAKLIFEDVNISLIKNFPNLSVQIEKLQISGEGEFTNDTLCFIQQLNIGVNIRSVISGDSIQINTIIIEKPNIFAHVLKDGSANWDIAIPDSTDATNQDDTENSGFNISLKSLQISSGNVIYFDESINLIAGLKGLNYSLSGDFSEVLTTLKNKLQAEALSIIHNDITYVKNAKLQFNAEILANLEQMQFELKENNLKLNNFPLSFDGNLAVPNDSIFVDVKFNSPETGFKDLISLVPAIFMKDFKGLTANGDISFQGSVKGVYYEDILPGFTIDLIINNGYFKYPDLPQAVDKIQIDAFIEGTAGKNQIYKINLKNAGLNIANNPISSKMKIEVWPKDIVLNGNVKADINLEDIGKIYPLDSLTMKGKLKTDTKFKGKYSDIENENYEAFQATGNISLNGFQYKSPDYYHDISVPSAEFEISPKYLDAKNIDILIGKTDCKLYGKIYGYLGYILKSENLRGNFNLISKKMDITELMAGIPQSDRAQEQTDTSEAQLPVIPPNINLRFQHNINTLIFDQLVANQLIGDFWVKNQIAFMNNLQMNTLKGQLLLNGFIESTGQDPARMDFTIEMIDMDIEETSNTLTSFADIVPVSKYCNGTYGLKMNLNSDMNDDFSLVYNTLNGTGNFVSKGVEVTKSAVMEAISSKFKSFKFKDIALNDLDIRFKLENGDLTVEPFELKTNKTSSVIYGTQNLDKSIHYTVELEIERNKITQELSNQWSNLASKFGKEVKTNDKVRIDVEVTGTIDEPEISRVKPSKNKSSTPDERDNSQINNEVEKTKDTGKKKIEETKQNIKEKSTEIKDKAKESIKKNLKKLW